MMCIDEALASGKIACMHDTPVVAFSMILVSFVASSVAALPETLSLPKSMTMPAWAHQQH